MVELHRAFMWDCDGCGRENFTRPPCPAISDEQLAEFREYLGIPADDFCDLIMEPTSVKCSFCGEEFDVDDHPSLAEPPP